MVTQRGGVLIYILVGVVLFGALLFVYTRSGNVSTSIAKKGTAKAASADLSEYTRMVSTAIEKLSMNGCSADQISYETPSGLNPNPNAPSDKHCHVYNIAGGNIRYRNLGMDKCTLTGQKLTDLGIGQGCGGTIYVGTFSGYRLYTTSASLPPVAWQQSPYVDTNQTGTNGLTNTNTILSLVTGTSAASICRALGAKWFLPTPSELLYVYNNRNTGQLAGTFTEPSFWSSRNYGTNNATQVWLNHQFNTNNNVNKGTTMNLRCMRSD